MILDNLKKLMERDKVSQSALAKTIGRDRSAVNKMLKGKRRLSAEEAKQISATYSWDIGDFFWALDPAEPIRITEKTETKVLSTCRDIISKIASDIGLEITEDDKFTDAVYLYQAARRIVKERVSENSISKEKEEA